MHYWVLIEHVVLNTTTSRYYLTCSNKVQNRWYTPQKSFFWDVYGSNSMRISSKLGLNHIVACQTLCQPSRWRLMTPEKVKQKKVQQGRQEMCYPISTCINTYCGYRSCFFSLTSALFQSRALAKLGMNQSVFTTASFLICSFTSVWKPTASSSTFRLKQHISGN